MDKIFNGLRVKDEIRAISSKSEAHRLLICAALGERECQIICSETNADIDATANCLNVLGAVVRRTEKGFTVKPIECPAKDRALDCQESGSTLRFLLPLTAALSADCKFIMRGRLPRRPLSPLYELLRDNGITLSPQGSNPLCVSGSLKAGDFCLSADVSSQFISGMLFALSVADGNSSLTLEGKKVSMPYVTLTLSALRKFGADIIFDGEKSFLIKGKKRLSSPELVTVGGDWSNASFFAVAGAIGKNPVTISGLDPFSLQGDRKILDILAEMGAKIEKSGDKITVFPSELFATDIDATDIPDLVPILAVAASVAKGKTRIFNAARLRLKESDRIESVCAMLKALGALITPTADGMEINGKMHLDGGEIDSSGDHRIAMSGAIASLVCKNPIKIKGFEAINKSYPSFENNFI